MSNVIYLDPKMAKKIRQVHAQMTLLNFRTLQEYSPPREAPLSLAEKARIRRKLRRDLRASLRKILEEAKGTPA